MPDPVSVRQLSGRWRLIGGSHEHPTVYDGSSIPSGEIVEVAPLAEVERLREALLAVARVPHGGDGDATECARERGRIAREALR